MQHQDAILSLSAPLPNGIGTVRAQTLLSELFETDRASPQPYFIVEDAEGSPVGIVDMEDVRERLNCNGGSERKRWMEMPVESILNGRLSRDVRNSPRAAPGNEAGAVPGTVLSLSGQLVAMLTSDDVFVSWRSIEPALRQAQHDHLTDLPLRSVFDLHLQAEFDRASRNHHSVAAILIDVDRFKEINDQYGHAAGDSVLSAVGRTLRRTFRSYDMVARYGGDEFAVLCCGCRPGEIDLTIKRLRRGMEKLHADLSIPRPIPTLSIGACVVHDPDQIENAEQIIASADECLYLAKREGRNRSFTTELGAERAALC